MIENQEIKILYIEDDESTVKLILKYLESDHHNKFHVIYIKTLKDSLEYLQKMNLDDIDVILMDLILPNSHGIDTYLSVSQVCTNIPIVIISEHEDIACECVKKGAQDYLLKGELNTGLLTRSLKYAIQRVKSECKYENIIKTSSLGYHLYKRINGQLIFIGYNPAANKILKIDNKQFLNKEILEAFPYLSKEVIEGYEKAIDGTPYVRQLIEYKDDNINHAYFIVNAVGSSKNNLVVTFEDITEKIKAQNILKESEERFRRLVEVTKAGMYEIDFIKNRFVYVNDVICEKSGYTKEELLSMSPLDILTKDSIEEWCKRLKKIQMGEYVESTVEYEIIKKDGSKLWVLITVEFIEDENSNITGANVVVIDIDSQKNIQKMLKEQEEKIFFMLEDKIHKWREETREKNKMQVEQLNLINDEINSMGAAIDVDVEAV